MSQETADLLIQFGKSNWVKRREQSVEAKGKGTLQTYWLLLPQKDESGTGTSAKGAGSCSSSASSVSSVTSNTSFSDRDGEGSGDGLGQIPLMIDNNNPDATATTNIIRKAQSYKELESALPLKTQRLVRWNCDVLLRLLKQIIARRVATGRNLANLFQRQLHGHNDQLLHAAETEIRRKYMVLEEVVEVIPLPGYDARVHKHQIEDPSKIEIPEAVVDQLSLYVASIALMYRDNHFHNFEHASHVMMSVSKLLSRIVAAEDIFDKVTSSAKDVTNDFKAAHDHTVRSEDSVRSSIDFLLEL
jgi:hypothetical protein